MLKYPQNLYGNDSDKHHAALTEQGGGLLSECKDRQPRLAPGMPYRVKHTPRPAWMTFTEGGGTDRVRHTCIIKKRLQPVAPCLFGLLCKWNTTTPQRGLQC